jgi:very-short-patch-repair endonuclease
MANLGYFDTAAAQAGALHRRHLTEAGVSAKVIRRLVADGLLDPVGPHLFVVGGSPPSWRRDLWLALLSAPPASAVSHRSAAVLHHIGRFSAGPIDITEPDVRHAARVVTAIHRSTSLPAHHLTTVEGLVVTTPARTVFDLARVASSRRFWRGWPAVHPIKVERALDDALASGTPYADFQRVLHDLEGRGRGGTVLFRTLLNDRGPGMALTESELEDLVERTFRGFGSEAPGRQREVGGTTAPIGRVDFYDAPARAVLEADGRKHHSELLDRERDAWRDLELAAAGFVVVRVTHRQLRAEPGRFVARWGALVERRTAMFASNS